LWIEKRDCASTTRGRSSRHLLTAKRCLKRIIHTAGKFASLLFSRGSVCSATYTSFNILSCIPSISQALEAVYTQDADCADAIQTNTLQQWTDNTGNNLPGPAARKAQAHPSSKRTQAPRVPPDPVPPLGKQKPRRQVERSARRPRKVSWSSYDFGCANEQRA
jgi:hypothetical protein